MEGDAKLAVYADFAGAIAGLFEENTTIAKVAAIAQATISTYLAAQKVFQDTPGGLLIRSLAAAAAVVAGLARVKQIMAVNTSVKGGAVTAPTGISSSPPAQRAFATPVQSTIFTQPQLTQGQLNALPQQNLLTADQIAAAFSKIPAPIVTVEDINVRINEVSKVQVRATI
jgi:hypothetical protein